MKWFYGLASTLATLWLLYVIVANVLLHGTSLKQRINRHPDRFFLEWTSASTWVPGIFHVRGVRFIGQGTRSVYNGRVDDARFRIALVPLLQREIRSPSFEGNGIEFRLTYPASPEGTAPPSAENTQRLGFPDIPGLEALPRRTAPRTVRQPSPWHIHATGIRMRRIEQIWIHQFRHQGAGELEASLDLQIDGPAHIRLARLEYPSATLDIHGATVARQLFTRARGELGPLVFGVDDEPSERLYDHLSLETELRGDLDALDALRQRVGSALPSEFSGKGHLDGRLRLLRGVLGPGTRLRIESPSLSVGVAGITFRGAAVIEDSVADADESGAANLARLHLHLDDLEVSHAGDVVASAPGRVLELESTTAHLALANPFTNAAVQLRLHPINVTNASFINTWIPSSIGVRIESGQLRAEADLHAGGTFPGSGSLKLEGTGLSADVQGQLCQTDLRLEVPMLLGNLGDRRGRIDGTSLTLSNVVVEGAKHRDSDPWHAHIGVPRGEVQVGPRGAWQVSGDVTLALRDTRPLVAVLAEQEAAPGWIRLMPTLHRLEGSARLQATPDRFEIRDARITGTQVDLRAELELAAGRTRGIAYAEYGPVGAGFDLRGDRSHWRIFGARRWYTAAVSHPFETAASGAEPDDTAGAEDAGGSPPGSNAASPSP